jgi:hypothetical protein
MSHEIKYSTAVKHPRQRPGEGRCEHVIRCTCGLSINGRGSTKKGAEMKAESRYRIHCSAAPLREVAERHIHESEMVERDSDPGPDNPSGRAWSPVCKTCGEDVPQAAPSEGEAP